MEALIIHYGVIAIFLGAGIEGEPFALAGGVLAHRGWLPIPVALIAAIGGAFAVDQMWFALSRSFSRTRIVQGVMERPAFRRSLALIDAHPIRFILLSRFAYGLRTVAPVAIGASNVPRRLFVPLDLAASVVWGLAFTAAGYLAGPAFEAAEARFGGAIAVGAVVVSAGVLLWALRRGR